jgi:hypothetical protein
MLHSATRVASIHTIFLKQFFLRLLQFLRYSYFLQFLLLFYDSLQTVNFSTIPQTIFFLRFVHDGRRLQF